MNSNNNARGTPFVKKEKVPIKLNPSLKTDIQFVSGQGPLKDAFTMIVSSGQTTREYTIHHPIGITDLDDWDWVMTETSEVQSLLQRIDDPGSAKLNQQRNAYVIKWAITSSLLKEGTGEGLEQYPNGTVRSNSMKAAREEADKEYNIQHAKDLRVGDVNQTVVKTKRKDPIEFMSAEIAVYENKLRDFWNKESTKKTIAEKIPQRYRTMSGPLSNIVQTRVNVRGFRLSSHGMFDAVNRQVVNMKVKGGEEMPRDKLKPDPSSMKEVPVEAEETPKENPQPPSDKSKTKKT